MGTTTDKLNAVLDSKEAIRQAIEYRGVDIPMDTTLAEYADKIGEIPTGGTLTDEQALVFIGECADGKRKIAKAVKSKYETITNEESGITEYSTFEELSNKISQIPVEVPLGSAMEQNGGVLPFYDVYNELVKASKQYTEYPYCCAMELDKWDYDNDHKITLSGADAYLTSDGVYLRSSEVNGEYQFTDQDKPNTNRFVVYFFGSTPYQVPKSLPATSVFGLWCLKGTPLMNFNADFTLLNSINVYDGELDVKEANDFKFNSIPLNQKLILLHIKSISNGSYIFHSNTNLRKISLPNLTTISGGSYIFSTNTGLREVSLPNLTTISGGSSIFNSNNALRYIRLNNLKIISGGSSIFQSGTEIIEINLPELQEITTTSAIIYNVTKLKRLIMPKLEISRCLFFEGKHTLDTIEIPNLYNIQSAYGAPFQTISTPLLSLLRLSIASAIITATSVIPTIQLGNGIHNGEIGNIKVCNGTNTTLTTLTVAEGFKAKLNLTGCNGLSREVLVDILNNLADLTGETSLNLIMGATLLAKLTDADKAIATQKNWTLS